jgi:hypothetical protein
LARQEQLTEDLAREQQRRQQLEQKIGQRPSTPAFFSFALIPGLARDGEGPKRLVIPLDAESIKLQLQPRANARSPRYRAALQNLDGDQLWSEDVPTASILVPARVLPAGDYMITLQGIASNGETIEAGDFYFHVIRK